MIVPEIMTGSLSPLASKTLIDGGKRRLGVQGVEDRLDDQNIRAALDQRGCRLGIGRAQIVEAHRAKARIIDVGRNRGGAIGRPQGAGDEAALAVLGLRLVGRFARKPRRGKIQFGDKLFHPIVGLRNPRRTECIRFDDVGTGLEIGEINGLDRLRLGEAQEIVVASQVARPIRKARAAKFGFAELVLLDHRAHGAVEHQNSFAGGGLKSGARFFSGKPSSHQAASCSSFGRSPKRWQIA